MCVPKAPAHFCWRLKRDDVTERHQTCFITFRASQSQKRWGLRFCSKKPQTWVHVELLLVSRPRGLNLHSAEEVIYLFRSLIHNRSGNEIVFIYLYKVWRYCLLCVCSVEAHLSESLAVFSTHPDSFLIIFPAFCLSRQRAFLLWGLQWRAHLPLIQKPWSETTKALSLLYALPQDIYRSDIALALALLCLFVCPKKLFKYVFFTTVMFAR